MYCKKFGDEQFNIFYQSLIESSKVNQRRLYVYMLFLFTIFLIVYSLTDESYLKNENMDLILINVDINIDTFLNFTAYSILLFHIFIIESLIEHHKKIKAFFDLETNLVFNNNKELYLYPFVFNHKGLYKQKKNLLSLTYFLTVFLLLLFPILNLYFLLLYYPNTIEIFIIVILVNILNFYFFIIKLIDVKRIIFIFYFICFSIILLVPFYYNYKFLIDKKNYQNLLENKKSKVKEYINLFKNDSFFMSRKKFINDEISSIHIKNRILDKFYFYNYDLKDSFFVSSTLKNFDFNELILDTNNYLNTNIENTSFFKTTLNNQIFKRRNPNVSTSLLRKKDYNNDIVFENITFYTGNVISNSIFDNLIMKNIEFYGENLIKSSEFISNKYEDVKFQNVEFQNVKFSKGIIGITDNFYMKKLKLLTNKRYYKKSKHEFFREFSKANIFKNAKLSYVTFKDIIIENIIFFDTNFNNIMLYGTTKFKNVTFMYKNKNSVSNEIFFRSIKNCKNCKYIDLIDEKLLINNDGNIHSLDEKLKLYK